LENYRYREQLFPSSQFRMAYDALQGQGGKRANREYLQLLKLAADEGESRVEDAVRGLLDREEPIRLERVQELVKNASQLPPPTEVTIEEIHLSRYDELLEYRMNEEESGDGICWDECEDRFAGVSEAVTLDHGAAML